MAGNYTLNTAAAALEKTIRANRLLNLPVPWRDEFIYPYYDGLSILNVVQTIGARFGLQMNRPLDPAIWGDEPPDDEIDRIVLFITDGLGYLLLKRLIDEDDHLRAVVRDLTDGRGPVPLTSIVPSTTTAALTTLWTAQSPTVHGVLGTRLFLREVSTLGDMLRFSPAASKQTPGLLASWGIVPEEFVPAPSLAQRLNEVGVPTHLLLEKSLIGTGLSRILHRGVEHRHPHTGTVDVWARMHRLLAETVGQRCYINVYWPAIDMLSHLYGTYSEYVRNEVNHQMTALRDVLASDAVKDGRSLVMVIADHGHCETTHMIDVYRDECACPIRDAMRLHPGGEERFSHLYLRDGYRQQVISALANHYSDHLAWIEPEAAQEARLFGPGEPHLDLFHRIGDLIVPARSGARFLNEPRPQALPAIPVSQHGGLSESEMLVPFLWKRI